MIKTFLFCLSIGLLEAITVSKSSLCSFPFIYKGQSYDECIKSDANAYWCSVEKVYNGTFSYCKVDDSDEIGDEHFLALIKRAEEHAARLQSLQSGEGSQTDQCSGCISLLKKVSESIVEQSAIFMDQNKRLQGLKAQHTSLNEVVDKLNKYYQLRRCRQTEQGGEYLGRVSVTSSGKKCQSWSWQKPHSHQYVADDQYAENSVENAKNYCRNPGLNRSPWCFTTDSNTRFEYCAIPRCSVDCNIDSKLKSDLPMCDTYASMTCRNESTFYDNNCYKVFDAEMDFESAEKHCQSFQGHLTSVHSSSELIFLAQTLFPGKKSFFVGLTDAKKEGEFVWNDGSKNDYQRFYGGEPNGQNQENCIEVGRYPALREAWNDISCNEKRAFVCKMTMNK